MNNTRAGPERALGLRRQTRYKIQAPISFEWDGHSGLKQSERGITGDISANGFYVLSPIAPPVGTRIRFTIFFPSLRSTGEGSSWPGEGRVVRSGGPEEGEAGFGVAAKFEGREA